MAKQGERTATGSFDYDILSVLTKMQDGISAIKKNTEGQKPYEEARDKLKKSVPKVDKKKVEFKLPKLPAGKSILDGLFGIGKLALAGAFLVGLLKDRIIEWFNSMGPDSVGSMIGKALAGLFTKDPGEAPMIERLKSAFRSGLIGAGIGATIGALVGGPIGIIAGAIIGFAAGALYDFLKTDQSKAVTELKEWWTSKTKGLWWKMALVGLIAATAVAVFGGPIGLVAAAIIGAALGTVLHFLTLDEREDDEKIKAIISNKKEGLFQKIDIWWRNITNTISEWFRSSMTSLVMSMTGKTKKQVHEDYAGLKPPPGDEVELEEELTQSTSALMRSGSFASKGMGVLTSKGLYNFIKDHSGYGGDRVEVEIPKNWKYLPWEVRRKLLENMFRIPGSDYKNKGDRLFGGIISAETGEKYLMRSGAEQKVMKGIKSEGIADQYKVLHDLQMERGVMPDHPIAGDREKYNKNRPEGTPLWSAVAENLIDEDFGMGEHSVPATERFIAKKWADVRKSAEEMKGELDYLTKLEDTELKEFEEGRIGEGQRDYNLYKIRGAIKRVTDKRNTLLKSMMNYAKENIEVDLKHKDPPDMIEWYNDRNQKIVDQTKGSLELNNGNGGNISVVDGSTVNNNNNGSNDPGIKVEPYNPAVSSGSGFTLQNMGLGRQ